jgi:hypothetical protein
MEGKSEKVQLHHQRRKREGAHAGIEGRVISVKKHNRSLKVVVQGLVYGPPLHIHKISVKTIVLVKSNCGRRKGKNVYLYRLGRKGDGAFLVPWAEKSQVKSGAFLHSFMV